MASLMNSSSIFKCSSQGKASPVPPLHNLISLLSSSFKPILREWKKVPLKTGISESIKMASANILDAFMDSFYKFEEQKSLNEGNYAPVEEIGEAVTVELVQGEIPENFPQGVYIRNGPNPLYPTQTVASSAFGRTSFVWVEGDGMLHATYFSKDCEGKWRICYNNKYVESETFLLEKQKKQAGFIPASDGQPLAIVAAYVINAMRFGTVVRQFNNTNVFEHGGKFYAVAENHFPHEIEPSNLSTLKQWDINGAWGRPFTSHPKKAPGTGELVIMGTTVEKPHFVVGVVSADGKKLLHKADLKFDEPYLIHELGVTERYNIIPRYPLRVGFDNLLGGKPFIWFNRNGKAKIGVMPRFGNEESTSWFDVENYCSFHIINCFEDGDEVIVRGCRLLQNLITGPEDEIDRTEWYQRAYLQPNEESKEYDPSKDGTLFSRPYEWRLNMNSGEVKEGYLTGKGTAMDFPTINCRFIGMKNKYAYMQVVDSAATSETGLSKFKMFAKLWFDEQDEENRENIKVEFHVLEENHFCSGLEFVEKEDGSDEDDGWVACYVHDESTNKSQVYIIDAKNFSGPPVAKIGLPQRVPYGFHGTFLCNQIAQE